MRAANLRMTAGKIDMLEEYALRLRNDMIKKSVYIACLLLAMAAFLPASAQEQAIDINGSLMNGTATLNNTLNSSTSNATFNESTVAPLVPATIAESSETLASPMDASPSLADLDESMPAENETVPAENLTSIESSAPIAVSEAAVAEPGVMALGGSSLITKPEKPIYAIGAAAGTPGIFPIGKVYLPDQAYNAGMSAETIMDLSALPFYINHM